MKLSKGSSLIMVFLLVMGISVLLLYSGTAPAQTKVVLSNDDCVKCHNAPPSDLAASGGKHKDVGCTGCHEGHPPTVKKPIPQCSNCHMGKPHFELKGCLGCHRNPHTPLKITFANNITDACLTCHTQQIAQLRENKSRHTAQNCSFCHDVHRKKPECTQCHKPHSAEMTAADCKKCHKAHMPKAVTYAAETPSKFCAACHKPVYDMLTASKVKHATFLCAFCHQEKHKMVPKCQDCHGVPHPAGIMAKFPVCGECHKIAHDLNNWPPAASKEAPKAAPKEKPKKKQ
jgi:predicted CXXCH cytochrome family protein